ncbi:MAG: aldo/keto reductase [Oribacterium sp.]|nr:aldo/keto reductase [Oribacterium sp.]
MANLQAKTLPKIALGAWAWGNDGTFGNNFSAEDLRPIFDTAMKNGLNLWDTAYAYGMGTSEKVLAGFLKGLPRVSVLVSDKFTPQCADASSPTAMKDMIEMQLKLMDLDRFDIYWIHNVWDAPKWTEELAKYFEGKDNVPLLGVSNHNLAEIRQADEILKAHGLKLSAVQNHYSLINRSSEESGILKYCRENDIHFFAYMVLEQGALSGKYDTAHPMPEGSARALEYNPVLDKLEILNAELKKLADKYGVGVAQIPVAWAIAKGTLPIIGVTKENQVEDAVKACNVSLTEDEVAELEKTADSLELNVIRFWEKEMK